MTEAMSRSSVRIRVAWTVGALMFAAAAIGVILWLRSGLTPPPQIFFLVQLFVLAAQQHL